MTLSPEHIAQLREDTLVNAEPGSFTEVGSRELLTLLDMLAEKDADAEAGWESSGQYERQRDAALAERDALRERLAAVEAVAADHFTGPISGTVTDWVPLGELRAALATGGAVSGVQVDWTATPGAPHACEPPGGFGRSAASNSPHTRREEFDPGGNGMFFCDVCETPWPCQSARKPL